MKTDLSPVSRSERIILLDILRGFAIFGILMVNMPIMFDPISSMLLGAKADLSLPDKIAGTFIRFFFEGKFYVLFSFLFGYGFWLFLSKTAPGNGNILQLFRRRLFFLLLFGLAHIALLWAGDILVFYSIFGFILILFRNSSNRKVLGWALGIGLVPTVLNGLMTLMFSLLKKVPEAKDAIELGITQRVNSLHELIQNATAIYQSGSFGEMIAMRFKEYGVLLPGIIFFYPVVLTMFLVGLWAARNRIIAEYHLHLSFFRKLFWWGLATGLAGNVLLVTAYQNADMASQDIWAWLYSSMHFAGGIALSGCYVSAMVLLYAKGSAVLAVKWLAPVGRMALTNYLMQSLVTSIMFMGWGFGLYGTIGIWQGMVITVVIFSLQIFFSRWWLSRFRFGPMEWLWRNLTYGKAINMSAT